MDLPTMDTVLNFREMGGLPAADGAVVKSRVLFRSGHWSTASEADVSSLANLDLHTVVDFRTPIDLEGDGGPDRLPDGVEHRSLALIDLGEDEVPIRETLLSRDQALIDERFGDGQAHDLAELFVERMALLEDKQAIFGRFLHTVAEAQGRPVLWHCSAGKDRAGWAATMLGIALGVPDQALLEHYLASNVHRPAEGRIAHYANLGINVESMRPFMMVHEDYFARGLDAIDKGWPNRESYLRDALKVDSDTIGQLRANLLT